MKRLLFFLFFPFTMFAQDGIKPIIDVHLHGFTERTYRPIPGAPSSYEEFKKAVKGYFEQYNIVAAMKSGGEYGPELEAVMLQGYESNNYPKFDTVEFKQMIDRGEIQVWGEFMPSFNGMTLADPGFAAYLKICEREGIPIALHTGGGPPGIANRYKKARLTLGDPFLIEEVLINYPQLKVYLMHSGEYYYEHALALMMHYPQLYAGLGVISWIESGYSSSIAEKFLKEAKNAGYLDRVMFGSDGGYWAHHIETAIKRIDGFDFLDETDKRKIFYENALHFFDWKHLKK